MEDACDHTRRLARSADHAFTDQDISPPEVHRAGRAIQFVVEGAMEEMRQQAAALVTQLDDASAQAASNGMTLSGPYEAVSRFRYAHVRYSGRGQPDGAEHVTSEPGDKVERWLDLLELSLSHLHPSVCRAASLGSRSLSLFSRYWVGKACAGCTAPPKRSVQTATDDAHLDALRAQEQLRAELQRFVDTGFPAFAAESAKETSDAVRSSGLVPARCVSGMSFSSW